MGFDPLSAPWVLPGEHGDDPVALSALGWHRRANRDRFLDRWSDLLAPEPSLRHRGP